MTDRVYCYPPDFSILRNKFAIKDAATLERVEREAVTMRLMEGAPIGRFDLSHLRAIHKHLFQDVYDWAGEIRTAEIAKGGQQFQPRGYIEAFAEAAGHIMGDVNYVHPFREGNGRTQLVYLRQLGGHAGHAIDLSRFERDSWLAASIQSHRGDYQPMVACIHHAIAQ